MFNKKNYQLENILFHQYTCPKEKVFQIQRNTWSRNALRVVSSEWDEN